MWTSDISSIVFTRVKTQFSANIKNKFNMTSSNFSTTDKSNKKAIFPFVYIWLMPSNIKDTDLERKSKNTVDFTFQIDVYDNQSQNRANEVAKEVMRIMYNELSFLPTPAPYFENEDNVFRMTARYFRTLDWNDIL